MKKRQRLIVAGRFNVHSPHWHLKSYAVRIRDIRNPEKLFKLVTGETAKARALQVAVQFCEEQAKDVPEVHGILLEKATDEWLAVQNVRPSAKRDYKGMLGMLRKAVGDRCVHEVTAAGFQKMLSDRKSALTRRKYIYAVRTFFRWAIDRGYAADDPTAGAKPGKIEEREREALTVDQAAALLRACRTAAKRAFAYRNRKPSEEQRAQSKATLQRLERAVLLGLYTGLRLGNVVSLLPSEIDLDAKTIRLAGSRTKTGRNLVLPIKRELAELMRGWKSSPLIGAPVEDLGRSFESAVKRAGEGFPPATFHWLRHSFATWIAKATKNSELVARLLGHSRRDGSATPRYVHDPFDMQELQAAVDSLPWIGATTPGSPSGDSESAGPACDGGSRPGA